MGLSCIRTSSTSHGIWFSSRKISFRMLGPHGMASPANGGSSNSKSCSKKQPSKNIMSANSVSLRCATSDKPSMVV